MDQNNPESVEQHLSELNGELAGVLTTLKILQDSSDFEEKLKATQASNAVLWSGVHFMPKVNSVIVIFIEEFDPFSEIFEAFWERFRPEGVDGLEQLFKQSQSMNASRFQISVPLPYIISSDTHGSADREAMMASIDTIHFSFRSPHKDLRPESKQSMLALMCESYKLRMAEIPVNWIDSITIGSVTRYTQVLDSISGELTDRMTPAEYFKIFEDVNKRFPGLRI